MLTSGWTCAARRVRVGGHHRGRDLHGPAADVGVERAQLLARHQHHRGGAVAGRAAHRERVRVRHHLGAHDLLEAVGPLVLGQRVQRRVGVVLLRHLGELLEADAVVLAGVVGAGLREHAPHVAGAEHALGRQHVAVATRRRVARLLRRLRHPVRRRAGRHVLDAEGQADVGLAGADLHDHRAHRGGARGARVVDVVERDARSGRPASGSAGRTCTARTGCPRPSPAGPARSCPRRAGRRGSPPRRGRRRRGRGAGGTASSTRR